MANLAKMKGLSKEKAEKLTTNADKDSDKSVQKTLFTVTEKDTDTDNEENNSEDGTEDATAEDDDGEAKTTAWERINSASKKVIKNALNNSMEAALDNIAKSMGANTDEAKEQIRAVIRGHLTVQLNQETVVLAAQKQVQNALVDYVNSQVKLLNKSKTMQSIYSAANQEIEWNRNINREFNKIANMSDEKLAKIIAGKLDTAFSATKYTDALDKFSNSINNSVLGKIGVRVDLAKNLRPVVKKIENDIAANLQKTLRPVIDQEVQKMQGVIDVVNKANEAIKTAREWVQNKIEQAEAAAVSWAKEQTQKLVTSIISSIKISF